MKGMKCILNYEKGLRRDRTGRFTGSACREERLVPLTSWRRQGHCRKNGEESDEGELELHDCWNMSEI